MSLKWIRFFQNGSGGGGTRSSFESEAARDAFFTANLGELKTDLPIIVTENEVANIFIWTGADSPGAYDATLFRPVSFGVSPGTIILGDQAYEIGNGSRILSQTDSYGVSAFSPMVRYDSSGSTPPSTHSLSPSINVDYALVDDTVLSDPQTMQFQTTEDIIVREFIVNPSEAGELRFQAFAGTLETGPVLVDKAITISLGQVDTDVPLVTDNPLTMFKNDFVLLKFSGVALNGGLQTSGPFDTQTVPLLKSSEHPALETELAVFGPSNAIKFPDGTTKVTGSDHSETHWLASTIIKGTTTVFTGFTGAQGITVDFEGINVFILTPAGLLSSYTLNIPWDFTSFSVGPTITLTDSTFYLSGYMTPKLDKFFAVSSNADEVLEYELTTPGDVTTTTFVNSLNVNAQEAGPRQVYLSADQTKFYMVGNTSIVFQYDMPIPGSLNGAVFSGNSFSVLSEETVVTAISLSPDGRHMYIGGLTSDTVFHYRLIIPWEISTAVLIDQSDVITGASFRGMVPSPDGSKLIYVDQATQEVVELDLGIKIKGKILGEGNVVYSFNGPDTFEIHSAADWEALAVAGVITISSQTTIKILARFETTTVINVIGDDLTITGDNDENSTITYTGSGTFITVTGDFVFRTNAALFLTATGGGTFISFTGATVLTGGVSIIDSNLRGWADLGTIERGFLNLINTPLVAYSAPFKLIDAFITGTISSVFGGVAVDFSWNDPTFSLDSSVNVSGFSSFSALTRISAFIPENVRVLVPIGNSGDPNVALFDTTGGSTGTYDTVANAELVSSLITAVADDGSGNASFSANPRPIVGQIVTISGFIINTAYNGTFKTISAGGGVFEVEDLSSGAQVQFGTNEGGVGNVSGSGITVGSTAHGLSNGDKLQLSSNLSTRYDGGYEIYNVFTNSFKVPATFIDTQTGTWDTSPIDQTNPNVLAFDVVDGPKSHAIACAHVNDNTTANGAIVNNTFTAMVFGTAGNALIQSSTAERWKLVDEIAGVFEYTGNEPFDNSIQFDFTVTSSGGTVDFRFKWEIDTGGGFGNLPDNVEALIAVGSDAQGVTKKFPLKAVKGNQIRPRITRNSGSSGITTLYATIFAGA